MALYICSSVPEATFRCNDFSAKGAFLGNHAVVLVRQMTDSFGYNS